uniref:Uncharacterized protein n=1 Tax=uncultured marine group II/III euryarchaeote AD1000_68_A11 TaxID=1457800 RepID=A0A075G190_9EURY|nr:hypothetical protein [uncultured marine group II/III euryarchaeote AD1000_68_A11]
MVLAAPVCVTRNGTGLSIRNNSVSWSVKSRGSTDLMASATPSSTGTPAALSRSTKSWMPSTRPPLDLHCAGGDLNTTPLRPLGARGLGVMTSLLQSEDHRFNSGRAHQLEPQFSE